MYLEKAFVINLLHHEDRLESFRKETASLPELNGFPEIEVWPAIHGDTCQPPELWKAGGGAWGCYKSHLNILEYCMNHHISSYIVFEDDARLAKDFIVTFQNVMNNLPEDWEQLYLGGDLMHHFSHPPVKVNDYVYRPYNVNRTHCFAVSRAGMLPIYQHISNLPFSDTEHVDHHLGRWHELPTSKVYCSHKWVVGQHGFQSAISGNNDPVQFYISPEKLALTHKLYDKPICIIYQGPSWLLHKSRMYLHPGNQVDAHGFDITLNLAAKMIDPLPEVKRWYDWIRSEVVRTFPKGLPCLFHTKINKEHLDALGIQSVILKDPKTVEEIEAFVKSYI
jgi:hypothetical protein